MKAYQAYGKAGRVTKPTPRQAALAYFDQWPTSRKCDVIQGETDGNFFTVKYGRASNGDWPESFKGITKKTASELHDNAQGEANEPQ
jgi:hypothetical protein